MLICLHAHRWSGTARTRVSRSCRAAAATTEVHTLQQLKYAATDIATQRAILLGLAQLIIQDAPPSAGRSIEGVDRIGNDVRSRARYGPPGLQQIRRRCRSHRLHQARHIALLLEG